MFQLKTKEDFKKSINQVIYLCPKSPTMKSHKDKILSIDDTKYYYVSDGKKREYHIETALKNFNVFILEENESILHSMDTTKSNNMTLNQSLDSYVFKKLHLNYELHHIHASSDLAYRKEYNQICQKYPQFFSCDPKSYIFWDDERIASMSEGEKLLASECRDKLISFFKKNLVLVWVSKEEERS